MKTVVKRSKIHGRGLFAAKFISKGDVLGVCTTRRTRDPNNPTMYTLFLDEATDHCVDVTCDFKFINHSDQPNVIYYDDLVVTALKDIEQGAELTHDYNCGDSDE